MTARLREYAGTKSAHFTVALKKRAKLKKAPPVNIKKLLRLLFMYNTQQ